MKKFFVGEGILHLGISVIQSPFLKRSQCRSYVLPVHIAGVGLRTSEALAIKVSAQEIEACEMDPEQIPNS